MNKLFILFILFLPTAIQAEIKVYDVEIVLFEDSALKYLDSEIWPATPPPEPEEETPTLTDIDTPPAKTIITVESKIETDNNQETLLSQEAKDLTGLSESENPPADVLTEVTPAIEEESLVITQLEPEYPEKNDVINFLDIPTQLLNEEAVKLTKSKQYNVLLHKAWRQTGLNKDKVIAMRINSSAETGNSTDNNDLEPLHDLTTLDQKIINAFPPQSSSQIKGSIKVELSRYLHVYADLIYSVPEIPLLPTAPERITDVQFKQYPMNAHRKLRSNELHYIDHALIGMLIKITPAVIATEQDEVDSQEIVSAR